MAAAGVLACGAVALVAGAEPQDPTREAWDAYAGQARQAFLAYVPTGGVAWLPDRWEAVAQLRTGEIVAGPGSEDGVIPVPCGLVHHWVGAVFIPDVSLDAALALSQTYADYPAIYESVIAVRLLDREGDTFRVQLRLEERAGFVTGVLDLWSIVRYVRATNDQAYTLSVVTEIREVADAGEPTERLRPEGNDSGYLWGAEAFTKYVARDGGVYVELETLGLSRGYPPLLGWIIEPIARRLGRKSVEGSLQEFRDAVREARATP